MCPSTAVITTSASVNNAANCRSAFDIIDVDRDGKISREDLHKFYPEFKFVTGEEHDEDENKNGFVEFEEFEKIIECKDRNWIRRVVMEEVFQVMDSDGDGKVGKEDLRKYMEWAGFEVMDEDIVAMIRLGNGVDHDDDDDGKEIAVTFDGFFKILDL